MATRTLAVGLVAALALAACGGDDTETRDAVVGAITISNAWVRPTPGPGAATAFYMTVDNSGPEPDRIVAARTGSCAAAELHETTEQDGILRMRPIADGIVVPAGVPVVLGPGGLHVMCPEVSDTLAEGQTVPLTLEFARAGPITVEAGVRQEP